MPSMDMVNRAAGRCGTAGSEEPVEPVDQHLDTDLDPDLDEDVVQVVRVAYAEVDQADAVRASRGWWDEEADGYQAEHGDFLGGAEAGAPDFVWCPEGLREGDAQLLGPTAELAGRMILEIG